MTIDEKRKYLSTYRLQEVKIERIRAMIFKYPERRERYMPSLHRAERLRDLIEDEVCAIDDELLSELLFQKYVCGKSLEKIALQLNYSKRQIERLHIKALEKFTPFTKGVF